MSWVHAVLDVPAEQHAATAGFWGGVLGWTVGAPWPDHPELCSFEPPSGTPYLHLQRIDGPPRVHVDVESEAPQQTVAHALDLGATPVAEHDHWTTLRSPGGLPFCVLGAREHETPGPVAFPDGHRARMVQVCIDSPRAAHGAEVAFWRELLPGRWADARRPEFAGKWHDDAGSPVQLLFQQLDEPEGSVRAHLDHGTDDLDAEVRRILALGATDIGRGAGGWHVMRDPAGQLFCATLNSPESTPHRDIG
ncbi:MAG TPA: VOC family protein [Nocardioides sp.]|uniref:VOC family protein n=1 Tax=Nocardioides sp. TaxID=35761 RepID=UPI002F417B05